MKKIRKLLITSMFALLFLVTACKSTPETEIIVDKSNDFFEINDSIQTTEQAKSVENNMFSKIVTPTRVESKAIPYKNISIAQNAEVIVPDAKAYPITEVSKRVFTDSDIIELIKLFTEDAPLYINYTPSKEDILKNIVFAKQHIGIDAITNEYIDGLQEQFYNAPEKSEKIPFDITKCPKDEYSFIYADTDNNTTAVYSFRKSDNIFNYSRNKNQSPHPKSVAEISITEGSKWSYPKTPTISESDALKIAKELMNKLDVDLKLRSSEPCAIREYAMQLRAGWQFVFTRDIAGLQKDHNYYPCVRNPNSLPSTGAPWEQEAFIIVVDEEGICEFRWVGASNVEKTLSKSETLEDFEVIQERVTNQINFIFGTDNPNDIQLDFTITKYELGIAMVSVKDQFDIGWYIPAWYVTYENVGTDGTINKQQIIFNAIDGSYIEPRVTTQMLMSKDLQ